MQKKKLKLVVGVAEEVLKISNQEHFVTSAKMAVNASRTSEGAQKAVGVSTVVIHTVINQEMKCHPQLLNPFLESAGASWRRGILYVWERIHEGKRSRDYVITLVTF